MNMPFMPPETPRASVSRPGLERSFMRAELDDGRTVLIPTAAGRARIGSLSNTLTVLALGAWVLTIALARLLWSLL